MIFHSFAIRFAEVWDDSLSKLIIPFASLILNFLKNKANGGNYSWMNLRFSFFGKALKLQAKNECGLGGHDH